MEDPGPLTADPCGVGDPLPRRLRAGRVGRNPRRGDIAEDTLDCPLTDLSLITQPGDGPVRTAVYKIAAPGGSWDDADNGKWTVRLLGNRVQDINFFPASGRTLGTFVVKL